jgi:hypothetical protein
MYDNIKINSTISGSVNDNIKINSTISGNIKINSTI